MSYGRFALALMAVLPLGAYTHFLHYGPAGQVIPEKFNLLQLQARTVTFFVSDTGPDAYSGNDSFPSVLNQVKHATQVWNSVATSDLRVAFGGTYAEGTPDNSPGGVVVFEDLQPGVLAFSGPTVCEDVSPDGPTACQNQVPFDGDPFLPILRSTMHLSRDLTKLPGPSFTETFFLVTTHEMGHALGLQHTFTSSTMSTIATRATSLAKPIDADDRAGLSDLYPGSTFSTQYGSISGQITYVSDDSPVHMASVVAIASGLPAISALTLPDGTFQINGVPPGNYYVFVHPLPPAGSADIRSPQDQNGNAVDPTGPFNAAFFPGVSKVIGARIVNVAAGNVTDGINMKVQPRASVPIYDVSIYSYFTPSPDVTNAAHPAYISSSGTYGTVSATGAGLTTDGNLTSGIQFQTLGGLASIYAAVPYPAGNGETAVGVYSVFSGTGTTGPQHLLILSPDYVYLLPAAFSVTAGAPPAITGAMTNGDGTVTVNGSGFAPDTQLFFDALPALSATVDPANGIITAVPPVGASAQTATLTAYNSDGQNSSFLQTGSPVTYTYGTSDAPSLSFTPSTLPAASEAAVEVTGTNTHFAQGRTTFGFGTHDAVVRQAFVLSPTHAFVNVGVPGGAAQIATGVSALTDFELATVPQSFQIAAPQVGLPAPYPVLFNGVPGQSGSFPGAIVSLYGANLVASDGANVTVTIGGQTAPLLYTSVNLINLSIPAGLATGVVPLVVNNGGSQSFPVMVHIDPPEPVITAVQRSGATVQAVSLGDTLDVLLTGFGDPSVAIDASRVQVSVGGVSVQASLVTPIAGTNVWDVQFVLPSSVAPGQQLPVVVYLDGRSSTNAALDVSPTAVTGN